MSGGFAGRNADYFSYQNMNELVELRRHCEFAEGLINRCRWEASDKQKLEAQYRQIQEKQTDEKLNLSVVGEFNSGKSTLINALLRTEILKEDIKPGMTAACTVLTHGDDYTIHLNYHSGDRKTYRYSNTEELREKVRYYTTDENIAPKIERVSITLPSENLKSNFRIIDTPGTNYTVDWHEEVTIRAIKEVSDLSIIVVDACNPMPKSLCDFLHNQLEERILQCVFMITKIDQLPEEERDRVFAFIRQKVQREFQIKDPVILPYVSLAVLGEYCATYKAGAGNRLYQESEQQEYLQFSLESEQKLLDHMMNQGNVARVKSLMELTSGLYASMKEALEKMALQFNYETAGSTGQLDFRRFIEEQKLIRSRGYMEAANGVLQVCKNALYAKADAAKNELCGRIRSYSGDADTIRTYASGRMESDLMESEKKLAGDAKPLRIGFLVSFRRQMQLFCNEFAQELEKANISSIEIASIGYEYPVTPDIEIPESDMAIKNSVEQLNKDIREGQFKYGLLGAGRAKREVVNRFTEQMDTVLKSQFGRLQRNCEDAFQQYNLRLREKLGVEMDRYLKYYRPKIDAAAQEQQERKNNFQAMKNRIAEEVNQVKAHQFRIESILENLNRMGSAE